MATIVPTQPPVPSEDTAAPVDPRHLECVDSAISDGDTLASIPSEDLDALCRALVNCALSWHRRRVTVPVTVQSGTQDQPDQDTASTQPLAESAEAA